MNHLEPNQLRFKQWLEANLPYLCHLFDFEKAVFLPERLEKYLGTASHGQAIMAKFVIHIWRHNNEYDFDLVEAAKTLDSQNMKVITDWLSNPFLP